MLAAFPGCPSFGITYGMTSPPITDLYVHSVPVPAAHGDGASRRLAGGASRLPVLRMHPVSTFRAWFDRGAQITATLLPLLPPTPTPRVTQSTRPSRDPQGSAACLSQRLCLYTWAPDRQKLSGCVFLAPVKCTNA
ncbi:hypothetical protein BaRGS_00000925 [Batillaria attramentaria]|uniref:Uncharacterized protein n=1 Tax=Batillaria attramentaria TaxID=370345 RepID=A0ABD0M8V4_9CAEN